MVEILPPRIPVQPFWPIERIMTKWEVPWRLPSPDRSSSVFWQQIHKCSRSPALCMSISSKMPVELEFNVPPSANIVKSGQLQIAMTSGIVMIITNCPKEWRPEISEGQRQKTSAHSVGCGTVGVWYDEVKGAIFSTVCTGHNSSLRGLSAEKRQLIVFQQGIEFLKHYNSKVIFNSIQLVCEKLDSKLTQQCISIYVPHIFMTLCGCLSLFVWFFQFFPRMRCTVAQ